MFDSSLVWDTVCGKGMSQEFSGAGLLDRERNPASSQWAQRGTAEPWALRRGFPEEMAAPTTSKSSPIPHQFPASMNQRVDFSKPILSSKTIPTSIFIFSFSKLLLLFILHPLPLTCSPVLHAGCGHSTQGWKGWVEPWNHQIS